MVSKRLPYNLYCVVGGTRGRKTLLDPIQVYINCSSVSGQ